MNEELVQAVESTLSNTPAESGLIEATQSVIMDAAENFSEALGTAGRAASSAAEELPFYQEVEFWIGLAFVLAMAVLLKPLGRFIRKALQNRVDSVRNEINDAVRLRDDAQKLLAEYERKFINVNAETEVILRQAKANLQNIRNAELQQLKVELVNKQKEAERRIAAAQEKARQEINQSAAKSSVRLAKKAIDHYLQQTDKSRLIDEAIDELDKFVKA